MSNSPELLAALELVRAEKDDRKNKFIERLKAAAQELKVSVHGLQLVVHDIDATITDFEITEEPLKTS